MVQLRTVRKTVLLSISNSSFEQVLIFLFETVGFGVFKDWQQQITGQTVLRWSPCGFWHSVLVLMPLSLSVDQTILKIMEPRLRSQSYRRITILYNINQYNIQMYRWYANNVVSVCWSFPWCFMFTSAKAWTSDEPETIKWTGGRKSEGLEEAV